MKHRFAFAVLAVGLPGFAVADPSLCTQELIAWPGSVEARVCFAKAIEALNGQIEGESRGILDAVTKQSAPFTAADFRQSQDLWRKHVAATCWLDASGAGNSGAVFGHCESKYLQQRLSQLKNLRASVTGGEAILWPMSNLGIGNGAP